MIKTADQIREEEAQRYFIQVPEAMAVSERAIEYRDITATPLIVQVPLVEYFERIKKHKADRWQTDLCRRLQEAAANRHIEKTLAVIHAEGQLGKTSIISQAFPAWLFGHDPLFRYALAMYNVSRSQAHSQVVIQIMQSQLHKDIFPNKDGWLYEDTGAAFGRTISKAGWMTGARRDLNDGQLSFNPVGLRSGLTGSGFDWLSIDDPYKEAQEAFSEPINEQMHNFYDYTVQSRVSLNSCISGMFHRYAPEDFAGFLLDTGEFDYWRYATVCDGPYIHKKTGRLYEDPLGRKEGEYIAPDRRPESYYASSRKNKRVWMSMFIGRPSDEEGEFFNVGKIVTISPELAKERESQVIIKCRAWDLASTEEAGAFSVGVRMGIRPDGKITVFEMYRDRVDTAERSAKQKTLAIADGADVQVVIPIDPGAAGQAVVWYTEQDLEGFTVVARATSGSKEQRAYNFSVAVNRGDVEIVEADWNENFKKELRDFPLSTYKDIVDASGDGYNHLFESARKGLVVKTYNPHRNVITVTDFLTKFGLGSPRFNDLQEICYPLPKKSVVYAGIKLSAEASRPSAAVICVRTPAFSELPEDLFVIDEYKAYDGNMYALFGWLERRFADFNAGDPTIWLHADSEPFYQTIASKTHHRVQVFRDEATAGHNELNWYLMPTEKSHPFGNLENAAHMYFVCPDQYFSAGDPKVSTSFYHARQELTTWGFDAAGLPTKVGQVIDCLRMVTHRFKTYAENYTLEEEWEMAVKKLFPDVIAPGQMTPELQQQMAAAQYLAKLDLEDRHGLNRFVQDDDLWFLE
jgi:predicted phage terminase large subunit-like protein